MPWKANFLLEAPKLAWSGPACHLEQLGYLGEEHIVISMRYKRVSSVEGATTQSFLYPIYKINAW